MGLMLPLQLAAHEKPNHFLSVPGTQAGGRIFPPGTLTDIHASGSVLIASFAGYGGCEYTYKVRHVLYVLSCMSC